MAWQMSYVLVCVIFCKGGRNAGKLKSICSFVHSGNGAKLMPSAASVLYGGSGQLTLTGF